MMNILKYLKVRYIDTHMSEKAQGMVEYALVLAFVVGIGWYLVSGSDLGKNIREVFDQASEVTSEASTNAQSSGN